MSERTVAVVLAGGLGTRVRKVLPDLPKPMAPVAGRPFVEWVLRYLAAQGIREAIISTGYRAEAFADHFEMHAVPEMPCVRCVAEPEPMGTAGGFLFAAATVEVRPARWLVVNGDSLILADLAPLFASFRKPGLEAALVALSMADASRYGSLDISSDDQLLRFREKCPQGSWINGGVYLLRDALLRRFPTQRPLSWEVDVFPQLLAAGIKVAASRVRAPFIDIGLPDTLRQADLFIRQNAAAFL